MNKVLLGTALLLSVAATSAVAGPNWNQASISYLSADFGDEDVSGVGISGTKLLNSNFFVAGGYSVLSEDVGNGVDLNLNTLSLGLGVRKAVANNTDIFGVVSFQNIELEAASGWTSLASDDASGYGLTAGARSMVL